MKYYRAIFFCTITSLLIFSCEIIRAEPDPSTNTIQHQGSSEHFDFYCAEKDAVTINDLQDVLEKNYLRITNDLQTQFIKKIRVYIYPDLGSFHLAMNEPNAPDWMVGGGGKDQLHMVSPLKPGKSHNYNSLMKTIVHEFTHSATRNLIGFSPIPRWLNEGFAYYEAGQYTDDYRKKIKTKVIQNKIPTLSELENSNNIKFGDMDGYGFSTTIIEYLVRKYGMVNVARYVKSPYSTLEPFGITKDQLQKDWIDYLREEYGK
jgi:hypothetical protein